MFDVIFDENYPISVLTSWTCNLGWGNNEASLFVLSVIWMRCDQIQERQEIKD